MAEKVQDYALSRTAATMTVNDLLDITATDNAGVDYTSSKMTVAEFLQYINSESKTLYNQDGDISGNRNVTIDSGALTYIGGQIILKMDDGVTDRSYQVKNTSNILFASMGFDQSENSGTILASNVGGTFFKAASGIVQVGTTGQQGSEKLTVGGAEVILGQLAFHGANSGNAAIRVDSSAPTDKIIDRGSTSLDMNFTSGVSMTVVDNFILKTGGGIDLYDLTEDARGNYITLQTGASTDVNPNKDCTIEFNAHYYNPFNVDQSKSALFFQTFNLAEERNQFCMQFGEQPEFTFKETSVLNILNMPTSPSGLVSGDIWNNSGTLAIVA